MKRYRGDFKLTPYLVLILAVALAVLSVIVVANSGDVDYRLTWVLVAVGVGFLVSLAWLAVSCEYAGDRESARGTLAIVALIAMLAVPIAIGWHIDNETEWTEVMAVVAVLALALAFFSTEWSRRWLLGMCVLAIALFGFVLARVGAAAERGAQIRDPIRAAIDERAVLDEQAKPKNAAAVAELDAASAASLRAFERLLTTDEGNPDDDDVLERDLEEAGEPLVQFFKDPENARPLSPEAEQVARQLLADFDDAIRKLPLDLADSLMLKDAAIALLDTHLAKDNLLSSDALGTAIKDACASAGSTAPEPCQEAQYMGGGKADLVETLHRMNVQLAIFRAAVSETDADKAVRDKLRAADAPSLDIPIWTAVARAPGDLIDQIGEDDTFQVVPGPVGWAVIAVALIFGLRVMLRRNAAQYAGPVQVVYDGDLKGELRVAVLTNIPTPGAAPGSILTQSVTDLTSVSGASAPFSAIAKAVTDALAPPQGYSVDADVVKPAAKSDKDGGAEDDAAGASVVSKAGDDLHAAGETSVLVRITSAADKETIATTTFSNVDSANAMRSAGLWAAGLLLGRSTRIPSWATWNMDTAKALAAASSVKPSLAELEEAVRTAPSSGIVLQQYGNALELEGRELQAVHAYARAVAAHPRHLLVRYRLGVALGMLGGEPSSWTSAPASGRQTIQGALKRAAQATGTDTAAIDRLGGAGAPDPAKALKDAATHFLDRLRKDLSALRRPTASLRRSDRDSVWSLQRQTNDPRRQRLWRLRRLADFAGKVYADPRGALSAGDERDMRHSWAGWQLMYNAACLHASKDNDRALALLEECLTRPGVHQLEAAWVRRDVDLKVLRGDPRFERFIERLEGRES